jgi:hypothetical protein
MPKWLTSFILVTALLGGAEVWGHMRKTAHKSWYHVKDWLEKTIGRAVKLGCGLKIRCARVQVTRFGNRIFL